MDSIPASHNVFPPDIVKPGTSFRNLTQDAIRVQIAEHEDAIAKLQAKIAHHHRAIARYRGCLNEVVPQINRVLPTELFSEIFLECSASRQVVEHRLKMDFYRWLKVAHVCRSWRNIVLSTPLLFSSLRIPTKHTSHLDEFLQFSRQANLHVRLLQPITHRQSDNLGGNWNQVVPHLPRTETLTLYVKPPNQEWPVCSTLTTFECTIPSTEPKWFHNLHHVMPALQILITTVEILGSDWLSTPLPPTIRTLKLDHTTVRPLGNIEQLVQKCTELPSLETLVFSSLQQTDYASLAPHDSVPRLLVRRLKYVSLSGSSTPILELLHHISTIERLDLSYTNELSGEHITSLSHILGEKLPPVELTPTTKPTFSTQIAIKSWKPDRVGFKLFISRSDGVHKSFSPSYDVQLDFPEDSLDSIHTLAQSLGSSLSSRLVLVTKCKITLEGGCDRSEDEIDIVRNILTHIPNVTYLDVDLGYPPSPTHTTGFVLEFASILDPQYDSSKPILLPHLRTWYINAREGTYPFSHKTMWNSLRIFFTNLASTVRNRKEAGLGVETLLFNASKIRHNQWYHEENPHEELTAPLREYVAQVDVVSPPRPYSGATINR
ncbi:hypothetical protein QCA50_015256 [Cerrena zonata]|uniref:F-box domain-containing protein n=1 Tax=Cerrena zonata TaxID=2478898 RepID=A0AAW0FPM0_9APHY